MAAALVKATVLWRHFGFVALDRALRLCASPDDTLYLERTRAIGRG